MKTKHDGERLIEENIAWVDLNPEEKYPEFLSYKGSLLKFCKMGKANEYMPQIGADVSRASEELDFKEVFGFYICGLIKDFFQEEIEIDGNTFTLLYHEEDDDGECDENGNLLYDGSYIKK